MRKHKGIYNILDKMLGSKLFAILCPMLTLILSALITQITKDWTWVLVSISVVFILLIVMLILSVQATKVNKDIVEELIKKDGLLDMYMVEKISELSTDIEQSSICMTAVQKECRKSIENFFLKQYSKIKFFNIDEILSLESGLVQGEIWIISDELSTDIENEKNHRNGWTKLTRWNHLQIFLYTSRQGG